jgi:hypothetical protein
MGHYRPLSNQRTYRIVGGTLTIYGFCVVCIVPHGGHLSVARTIPWQTFGSHDHSLGGKGG